jgi:ATP-binding cassette subfamily C protein LapB
MLAGRVMGPIAGIAAVITRATQTITSLKAIDRVMELERERPIGRTYISRRITEGRVAFENVTFKYPNAPDTALDKVSFKIEPGERVGIIGRVGSDKTTVGRLLVGFYDPAEGRISIDGIDARQYDPADLPIWLSADRQQSGSPARRLRIRRYGSGYGATLSARRKYRRSRIRPGIR